jgi:hypothetical protein
MAQPRGQPPEGGEVVVTPQGVPVLVQRVFDSAEGPDRLLQRWGYGRRPGRGRVERCDTLAQDREALAEVDIWGWRIVHGCLPAQQRIDHWSDRRGIQRVSSVGV